MMSQSFLWKENPDKCQVAIVVRECKFYEFEKPEFMKFQTILKLAAIGVASMRQENCLLQNFQIDNEFDSCFASSNEKMIQISTNYHKLVFVLQRCTTKTLQQLCRIQKFPRGNTPDYRFRGVQRLLLFSEIILKL